MHRERKVRKGQLSRLAYSPGIAANWKRSQCNSDYIEMSVGLQSENASNKGRYAFQVHS
jgi:hypothetical protein